MLGSSLRKKPGDETNGVGKTVLLVIPIIIMGGCASAALAARATFAGVAEVLAKPLVSGAIAPTLAAAHTAQARRRLGNSADF